MFTSRYIPLGSHLLAVDRIDYTSYTSILKPRVEAPHIAPHYFRQLLGRAPRMIISKNLRFHIGV